MKPEVRCSECGKVVERGKEGEPCPVMNSKEYREKYLKNSPLAKAKSIGHSWPLDAMLEAAILGDKSNAQIKTKAKMQTQKKQPSQKLQKETWSNNLRDT